VIVIIVTAAATWFLSPVKIKREIVEVEKIHENIVEVIVERPDGTKETRRTIDRRKDTTKKDTMEKTPSKNDWTVGLGKSMNRTKEVYTLNVSRRVIWDLSVGGYGRTDGEFGVTISYSY